MQLTESVWVVRQPDGHQTAFIQPNKPVGLDSIRGWSVTQFTPVGQAAPTQDVLDSWVTSENVKALVAVLDECVLMKTKLQREADRACAQHHEVARKLVQAKETIVWLHAELAKLSTKVAEGKRLLSEEMQRGNERTQIVLEQREQIAKLTAAARMALDALVSHVDMFDSEQYTTVCQLEPAKDAIIALRAALGEHE